MCVLALIHALFTANQTNQPTEKERKVRDEYERKLSEMQKEMKRLQLAKKEHARLIRNQTEHENQVKTLKNDLQEMKRAKVSLYCTGLFVLRLCYCICFLTF
jgi:phage host-nuclease inhibitor protein Gam